MGLHNGCGNHATLDFRKTMNELLCHAAFDAPLTASGEMMFMPAGSHTITPSQAGKAVKVTVLVTPAGAQELEAQRAALEAKGKRPYFDFNHEDGPASFWPTAFYWKDGPAPGIYCRGEWSDSGRTAVEGKEYRQFSPVFHVDNVRANPAQIVARELANPNMGGLVNNPAFSNILPFWAKNADGAHSITTNHTVDMTPQELAALQAKNTELQKELDGLKAQAAKDQSNAALAAALSAKESEVKLSASVLENETLKAKNADLVNAENARRSADADKAIVEAVSRGAIAAKDEEGKKSWKALIVADPSNAALLAKVAGNPAINSPRIAAASGIAITGADPRNVITEFAAIIAKSHETTDVSAKGRLSRDLGALYASEFHGANGNRILDMPLIAADSTDSNLGTVAGSLVTQRTLELLKFQFPALTRVTADFSDQPAQYGQTVISRTVGIPGVETYNTSTGWANATASTSDVPVTINQHKGVSISFGANLLASTLRRLFDEFAPAAAYALAKDMVDALYANITDANFTNNTVKATASFDRSTVIDIATAMNLRGVPMGADNRTLLLYSTLFGALAKDSAIVTLAAYQRPGIIEQGRGSGTEFAIPVHGLSVHDAPNLPTNNGNVTGFAFSKSALVIATRVPNDYTSVLPGASFGNVSTITDPDLGVSVQQVQFVNHTLGTATQRIAVMYGTAAGQGSAGQLLKAAASTGSSR